MKSDSELAAELADPYQRHLSRGVDNFDKQKIGVTGSQSKTDPRLTPGIGHFEIVNLLIS
jgi:hypothetical protein